MPAERGDMHDRSCSGFCIEYREVECEAKTDRVCWGQFGDEVACTVEAVEDFVVEYREVECEAKTDRVCWGQFGDEVACTVVEYREVECEAKTDRRQIGPPEMRDL